MKKIMFNEQFGLQQATFDGTKTMTRRVVPDAILNYVPTYQQEYYEQTLSTIFVEDAIMNMVGPERMFQRYVYQVGEIVAVAQRYRDIYPNADFEMIGGEFMTESKGWSNKMFVKPELMPRHIKITGIKVEPLCGISYEDCLREGIKAEQISDGRWEFFFTDKRGACDRPTKHVFLTPYRAFKALIDKLNRRGFFESNPLVFAYSYEIID